MVVDKFSGQRQLTIRSASSDPKNPNVAKLLGSDIGADGMKLGISPNEMSIETQSAKYTMPAGVSTKQCTVGFNLFDGSILGKVFKECLDTTGHIWAPVQGACGLSDVTIAYERVCPNADGTHTGGVLIKHAVIVPDFEQQFSPTKQNLLEIPFYLQPSPASEYGFTGAQATLETFYALFDGTYDPINDVIVPDAPKNGDNGVHLNGVPEPNSGVKLA